MLLLEEEGGGPRHDAEGLGMTPATWSGALMLGWRVALVVVAVTILGGCRSTPIPPTYTQEELKAICARQGGWWRPDDLAGGYCEYQQGGFP
jgi:hypothetical protein